MSLATMTSKGQITLPKDIRDALGLEPGTKVDFRLLDGRTFLLGDHLTVADFAVSVTLPQAETIRLPLEGCNNIKRWVSQLQAIPAWRDPFPPAHARAA